MSFGIVTESKIEFDFSRAKSFRKHDNVNNLWPGVDFEIEGQDGAWIWLEIKNWEPPDLDPRRRGGQRWSFLCKMRSDGKRQGKKRRSFFQDLREKFLGTSAFLSLTKSHPQTQIQFVVLIESPKLTSELLGHCINRMDSLIPGQISKKANTRWPIGVNVSVVNVAEWNNSFPDYPAKTL